MCWQGRDWTPDSDHPAAHPNSRFTVAASQCATIADTWDDPAGVPVDAIIFGGRRATNVPLVAQARDWEHGVYMGATLASERTAAAEGTLGELRRDPFAMLPFSGIHMADHWQNWLDVGAQLGRGGNAPQIFQVNWFRRGADGRFLWPGFSENSRVLACITERIEGRADAVDSPFGLEPVDGAIDHASAGVSAEDWEALFEIDPQAVWVSRPMTRTSSSPGWVPRCRMPWSASTTSSARSSETEPLRVRWEPLQSVASCC